ncbi:MAG: hypothetical protein RI947_1130 [Candidatus Parcubacteria bacterium]|jgi:tetratricopeptide (TPR) repeat protein
MTTKLTFQELFKKFRLRSELDTLHDFGDAISQEGVIYDDTIYSHWQKGNKLPRERHTALAAIRVFAKRNGITTLKEANLWLESLGMGYLTDEEIAAMPSPLRDKAPFQAPKEISNFTGRDEYIKEISRQLIEHKSVLIHGGAGRGKTSLAIKLAYLLRDEFVDGVLWYRVDTSTTSNILTNMAYAYGKDITNVQDEYMKASIVRSLLSDKKILVILDNVEPHTPIDLLLPTSNNAAVLVTSQSQNIDGFMPDISLGVYGLHEDEVNKLYTSILSKPFMAKHGKALKVLAKKLEHNPLAIQIAARQIRRSSRSILHLSEQLNQEIEIEELTYENKNIYTSVDYTFKKLTPEFQKMFISLGVFEGADFSLEAVSYICSNTLSRTGKNLEKLKALSLVEDSNNNRYRLHPFIRTFVKKHKIASIFYKKSGAYYAIFLKNNKYIFTHIEQELENILAIYKNIYELKYWNSVIEIWLGCKLFLWDTSRWDEIKVMGQMAYNAADIGHNAWKKSYIGLTAYGLYYYWQGDVAKSIQIMEESLRMATDIQDEFLIAYAKLRLGRYGHRPIDEANSFRDFTNSNNYHLLTINYRFFAFYNISEKNYDKALHNFECALSSMEKIEQTYTQQIEKIIIYSHIALLYTLLGNYSKAKTYFTDSLNIEEKRNIKTMNRIWIYMGLGLISEFEKKIPDAVTYFKNARDLMEILTIGSNVYKVNQHISVLDKHYQKSPLFNKYIKPLLREAE